MSTEKKEDKKSFDDLKNEVEKNPGDFTAWTSLLTHVEHNVVLVGIESAREVFNSFFDHYPYCYGYWKKLADMERKNCQDGEEAAMVKCQDTFEKGLEAIPLSVDLWIQYINFKKQRCQESDESVELVRGLFKKAIEVCGTEFRSDRLWDLWIQWETEQQNLINVTAIYDKLIATPTQLYTQHFEKLQAILEKYPLHDTLRQAEIDDLRGQYEQKKGEGATDEDETTFMKSEAVKTRKDVHKKNEEACTIRWPFEEAIKRPYFHVKPLEKTQIKNWRDYLDLEIEMGDRERIRLLFERCLIACALYEDMWMKYIRWAESAGDTVDSLISIYKRACGIHLRRKPTINLAWLAFVEDREQAKNMPPGSTEILLKSMEERFVGCVAFSLRQLNVLRRLDKRAEMEELYKRLILDADNPKTANSFAIKYARFLSVSKLDTAGAMEILKEASSREPDNIRVYLTMIDLAIKTDDSQLVEEIFRSNSKIVDLPQTKKLELLQRKVEYYEETTHDVGKAQQALEEYTRILKLVEKEKDRKRPADENGGPEAKKKSEDYMHGTYYERNGQNTYGTQAGSAYGQHSWNHQGYGQTGYGGSSNWNGQQQSYTASYHY